MATTDSVDFEQVQSTEPDYEVKDADGNTVSSGDFQETNYSNQEAYDPLEKIYKQQRKADISTALITIGLNSIPIVSKAIRNRKNLTPQKVDKYDVTKLIISSAIPVFQAIDTTFNKGNIQKAVNGKLENSVGLKINDIRNIVNLVNLYPSAHHVTKRFVGNVASRASDPNSIQEKIEPSAKTEAWIGLGTLLTPYVTEKFSDDTKSFMSKFNSVIPIAIFGRWFRTIALSSNNNNVKTAYQVTSGVLNAANYATRQISPATRNNGSGSAIGKIASEANTTIDTLQRLIGDPRTASINGNYQNDFFRDRGYGGMSHWNF